MARAPLLQLSDISLTFGGDPVFAGLTLSVQPGDRVALVGRNGKLEDIDGPLLFLCSNASAYVTGQVLMVDGGFTAK